MEIKRELPQLSKSLISDNEFGHVDLKSIDTKTLLNFAEETSNFLKTADLSPKVKLDRLRLMK